MVEELFVQSNGPTPQYKTTTNINNRYRRTCIVVRVVEKHFPFRLLYDRVNTIQFDLILECVFG